MAKQPQYPMIVEDFPEGYHERFAKLPFLSLIEYGNEEFLTVIDMVTSTSISVYVLDSCASEGIDEVMVVSLIHANWEAHKDKPLSVMFGALNIHQQMARVHRTFQLSDITRIIGRFPAVVNISPSRTVKRRRRREVDISLVSD